MTRERPYDVIDRFLRRCVDAGIRLDELVDFVRDCGMPALYSEDVLRIAQADNVEGLKEALDRWRSGKLESVRDVRGRRYGEVLKRLGTLRGSARPSSLLSSR